jgi:hypothetical protein
MRYRAARVSKRLAHTLHCTAIVTADELLRPLCVKISAAAEDAAIPAGTVAFTW